MRILRWRVWVAAALALPCFAGVAGAQVVGSPEVVRSCLCKEQAVASLDAQVQAQSRDYDAKRQAFAALDKQVQQSRPRVDVNNPGDVDAFKRLLAERDAAGDALSGPVTESYAAAVKRYNAAVADYNAGCAGKAFDQDVLAREKRTLSCPKP